MSIEQQIADLTTATTDLLDAVNVRKSVLDDAVQRVNDAAGRLYAGTYDLAPETRPDGSQILDGDRYINSLDGHEYIRVNGSWSNSSSAIQAAQIQADRASSFSAQAEAQAVRAEVACDAAQLSAGVYATTAAGLAATTNGQYFSVPSGASSEYLILYQNSSGTAVEVKRYPSAEAFQALRQNYSGPAFVVTDQNDHKVLEVQRAGGLRTKLVNLTGSTTVAGNLDIQAGGSIASEPGSDVTFRSDGTVETDDAVVGKLTGNKHYLFAVTDEQGNAILAVNALGQLVANFDLVPTSPVTPVTPVVPTGRVYDYSVNQIFGYGQSLSVGQATPAISTSQNYDNLMFYRGMRPQYDYTGETAAQWYASLVPAIEAQSPTQSVLAETPSMGTADMIKELILSEDGKSYTQHQYQILISTPGYGATTIGQLSKGGTHFARMVEQATYGKTLANAAGKTHAVQAVTWTQGESDYLSGTTQADYVTALNTLISDINTDIKAATGQTKNIPVIGYQISSHIYYASDDFPDIALAQLEVEAANPLFYIACAMYPFAYHSGGHITNSSTRWLGGYYGLAYKRIVINGEDWKPLKPIASVRQSNFVEIRFNVPKGPLVFDTTQVAAQTNYGFALLDQNGAAMTISGVQIIDTDRIRITASAPIPAGAKVRYAFTGDTISGKGNLRDSQGDTITFAIPGSTAKRMDNWCLIFELGV